MTFQKEVNAITRQAKVTTMMPSKAKVTILNKQRIFPKDVPTDHPPFAILPKKCLQLRKITYPTLMHAVQFTWTNIMLSLLTYSLSRRKEFSSLDS